MGLYLGTSKFNIVNHTPGIVKNVTENLERAETALNTYAPTIITITASVDGITSKYYIENGCTLTIDDPVKEGYDFTGWYLDDVNIDLTTYVFTTNVTIHARFKECSSYVCRVTDFKISGSTISAYTGTDEYIEVPASYSEGYRMTYISQPRINIARLSTIQSYYSSITLKTAEGVEIAVNSPYTLTSITTNYPSSAYYLYSITMQSNAYRLYNAFISTPIVCDDTVYDDTYAIRSYLQNKGSGTFVFSSGEYETYGPVEGTSKTITTIAAGTFSNNAAIKGIKINEGITTLNYSTTSSNTNFNALPNLEVVYFPSTLTTFSSTKLFRNCPNLTSISIAQGSSVYDSRDNCNAIIETATNRLVVGCGGTVIPSSITTIGEGAFYYCDSLTNLIIPSSITHIERIAFSNCTNLKSIDIPDSVTIMDDHAFYATGLTTVCIPKYLEVVPRLAFCTCASLTSITFAEGSITNKIDNNALAGTGLINVIIPSHIKTIGSMVFANCQSMTSIYIPKSVTSILSDGGKVFNLCTNKLKIYCEATSKPSGWASDWNVGATTLPVTWGVSLEEYKSLTQS